MKQIEDDLTVRLIRGSDRGKMILCDIYLREFDPDLFHVLHLEVQWDMRREIMRTI